MQSRGYKGHCHWLSVWLHNGLNWAGSGGGWEGERKWSISGYGGGVDQLEDIINAAITYQSLLELDLFICDFIWSQMALSMICTFAYCHLMRGAKGTVDQVWAGKDKQTAMGPEQHVQTHKYRPDLILPMFFLLLARDEIPLGLLHNNIHHDLRAVVMSFIFIM